MNGYVLLRYQNAGDEIIANMAVALAVIVVIGIFYFISSFLKKK